jgi:hypothetical protein
LSTLRYYVQLPTEKAHEFHGELQQLNAAEPPPSVDSQPETPKERLDPRVRQKIRELVAMGETSVYAVRKQLRSAPMFTMFLDNPELLYIYSQLPKVYRQMVDRFCN